MPLIRQISTSFSSQLNRFLIATKRGVVSFAQRERKKGARRRVNWTPKLLRNRLYKGYGSGTMMSRDESGQLVFNPRKVRHFRVPSAEEMEGFNLRPYVATSTPNPETPAPTEMDYLKLMEQSWSPATKEVFERMASLKLDSRPPLSGRGRWGW